MWKKIPLFVLVLAVGGCSFVGSFAAGAGDAPFDFSTWKPYALAISALTSAVGLALSLGQLVFGTKPLTLEAFLERAQESDDKQAMAHQEQEWVTREQGAETRQAVREAGAEGQAHTTAEHARTREEIAAFKAELLEKVSKGLERPLDAEEAARVDEAVERILSSNDARLKPVEDDLREENYDDAYSRLMGLGRQSSAGASDLAADAFEHFSNAGAIFLGRDTLKAIEAFEAARDAKPDHFWTRVELSRLWLRAGQTVEAEVEARACQGFATTDRERSVALNEFGNVLLRQGRTDEALNAFEGYVKIARDLLASDPDSAQAERDVSISLSKVGNVLLRQGRTEEALTAFKEGLELARDLLASDPGRAQAKRDVSVSLNNVGDVLMRQGRTAEALATYEEGREVARDNLKSYPGSAESKRDLWVSLNKVGEVFLHLDRTDEALTACEEGLGIARDLLACDPGSAQAKRDVSASLDRIGDVFVRRDRTAEALRAYEEGFPLRRDLLASDPGSAEAKRDLVVSLAKLGGLSGVNGQPYWHEANTLVKELHDTGRLNPEDAWMLDATAKNAGLNTSG